MSTDCLDILYKSLLVKPQQVLDLFLEYYPEDRVELMVEYEDHTSFLNIFHYFLTNNKFEKSAHEVTIEDCLRKGWIERIIGKEDEYNVSDELANWFSRYMYPTIMVHYPEITITNENDKSHTIYDLYTKIIVEPTGYGGHFTINRSTYTQVEYYNHYMHSHAPRFDTNHMSRFSYVCLGNGPIARTISLLNADFDLDLWRLYIVEFDNFLHTESLTGGPYIRLESLNQNFLNLQPITPLLDEAIDDVDFISNESIQKMLLDFQTHILSKKILKFNYVNNCYGINMSMEDFTLAISNEFIKWYNEHKINPETADLYPNLDRLRADNFIVPAIKKNTQFYVGQMSVSNERYNDGYGLFTFKGRDVYLRILLDNIDGDRNTVYLLKKVVVQWILRNILILVNQDVSAKLSRYVANSPKVSKRIRVL
jgi:hypothetical protein